MNKIKTKMIALALAVLTNNSISAFPGYQWEIAAESVGIDPVMLYAVALTESASYRGLNMTSPWPYTIRNGSNATYASSKAEAEKLLHQAVQESEKHQLDIGLMQINLHWHGHRVNSATDLLDPVTNLTLGSHILAEAIKSSPDDLELGIGHYHSRNEKRARLYGQKVLSIYRNILHELEKRQ
ncbi:MAG: lytic transglycosylase domain-containing protein [Shewanella sp.]|uniref:lytic transglycosylase domain-containing protein n=1 Tax=Shewanella sp. TaxID=50422 RepID=UPI003F33C363